MRGAEESERMSTERSHSLQAVQLTATLGEARIWIWNVYELHDRTSASAPPTIAQA